MKPLNLVAAWIGCDNAVVLVYLRGLPTLRRFKYLPMICLN